MTNKIALWLGVVIVIALALDYMLWGMDGLIFLFRKFEDITEWMAFWR